jgi:hypothetical protein
MIRWLNDTICTELNILMLRLYMSNSKHQRVVRFIVVISVFGMLSPLSLAGSISTVNSLYFKTFSKIGMSFKAKCWIQ